ncbi:MAG: polar amino acid transport system substrate-binding protein [Alteromonadaceae bacterium]|jgi:polar amino acid transport system substrate-binding protein
MILSKVQINRLVLLAGLFFFPINAANLTLKHPLRVVTEELPPYNYRTIDGSVAGTSTQVVEALLQALKMKTKIELLPWPRAYKDATTLPNVLIYSITRTADREDNFHWLSEIVPIDIKVFALPDATIMPFNDLNFIGKNTLGLVRHSSRVEFVYTHKNITKRNLIFGSSFEQLYRMNQLGRVDMFMAPDLVIQYFNHKHKTNPHSRPVTVYVLPKRFQNKLYMALSKTTPMFIVDRFKKVLDKMHKSGEIKKIITDYQEHLTTEHKH